MYLYIYACNNNEKDNAFEREQGGVIWEGLDGGTGGGKSDITIL